MWHEIVSNDELHAFMERMYAFHDSCIKEIKYCSGAYVTERLTMCPGNGNRVLKMIVQRQFETPSVIEMEFAGLHHLSLFLCDEKYTCDISDATMVFHDNCIYWCDCGGLFPSDFETYKGVLICASKVRWREADEYIGKEEVYVGKEIEE